MKTCAFVFSALTLVALTFAETIKYSALDDFDHAFHAKLAKNPGKYPFEVLFSAPGVYVPGMGVTLTSRVNLVYWQEPSPFRPAFTPEELETLRQHKLEKIPILEQNMREVIAEAAQSPSFDAVPAAEHISLGVSLFNFVWENQEGLPHQITMSAQKQQLLKARCLSVVTNPGGYKANVVAICKLLAAL